MKSDRIVVAVHDRQDPSKWINIDKWVNYQITRDIWSDCGRFTLTPTPTPDAWKIFKYPGQRVEIWCNEFPQMSGIVDDVDAGADSGQGSYLTVTGRDNAGLLVDSSAPRMSLAGLSARQIVEKLCQPWYPKFIAGITTNNAVNFYKAVGQRAKDIDVPVYGKLLPGEAGRQGETTGGLGIPRVVDKKAMYLTAGKSVVGSFAGVQLTVGKIAYRPVWKVRGGVNSPQFAGFDEPHLKRIRGGEKVMEVIKALAQATGTFVHMGPDSWLTIAKPRYKERPYGKLIFRLKGKNNVKAVTRRISIAERFSAYLAYGKAKKRRTIRGRENRYRYGAFDPSPAFWEYAENGDLIEQLYKPTVFEARKGKAQNSTMLRRLVRRKMEEALCKGLDYQWEVIGHHDPDSGLLWCPDACVEVLDEKFGVSGLHYIVSVVLHKDPGSGTRATLRLIPADIWLYDTADMNDEQYGQWMSGKGDW